jgi:hypothetical protein
MSDMAQGQRARGRRQRSNNGERAQGRADMNESGRGRGRSELNGGDRGRAGSRARMNAFAASPENMLGWADVTQNAMRDFVSMWSDAAQESLRLATELQQAQVDAARDLGRIFTQSAERMRRVA